MKAISEAQRQQELKIQLLRWLRRYFIAAGLVAIAFARWKIDLFIHSPKPIGQRSFRTCVFAMDYGAYVLVVILLLAPWRRLGGIIAGLGYAIALPGCTFVVLAFLIVDLIYAHQQILFQLLLLSGLVAQILWIFIPLGDESRQLVTANLCKQHLRDSYRDKLALVEEFILHIEGERKDIARWSRFADSIWNKDALLKRLNREWVIWSNPSRVGSERVDNSAPASHSEWAPDSPRNDSDHYPEWNAHDS